MTPAKQILFILLLLCSYHLEAQEKGKISFGIETGLAISSDFENLGLLVNVEPKYWLAENSALGLRLAGTINARALESTAGNDFNIDSKVGNTTLSVAATYDYSINQNRFRPFVGAGIGYYSLDEVEVSKIVIVNSEDSFEVDTKGQIGFLIRSGFEIGKLGLGIEYNIIPKVDIQALNGATVGKVNDSYFALKLGFKFGGGTGAN